MYRKEWKLNGDQELSGCQCPPPPIDLVQALQTKLIESTAIMRLPIGMSKVGIGTQSPEPFTFLSFRLPIPKHFVWHFLNGSAGKS